MLLLTDFLSEPASASPQAVTEALQIAIDQASQASDTRVAVPAGRWMIRTIFLRNSVTLVLQSGATLVPDSDLSAYPVLQPGHNQDRQPFHLIMAENVSDVSILGPGTIDGRGEEFWEGFHPAPNDYFHKAKAQRISPLLNFVGCQNLQLRDFTIRNSPGWTVHTLDCDHVRIDGLVIDNNMVGPNTDGLDINGCRHVFVSNCRIHGCDDNIIIKATHDARSCEHIVVTNCVLESLCAAIGIGAETASSIRYITVSNCTVINAIRMIQIIMWDGGIVENCTFTNITGTALTRRGTDRAIHFDIQEHKKEAESLGIMRNIMVSNVICRTRGRILMTAQDGAWLENITLRDVLLDYPEVEDPAFTIPRDTSSQLSNFSPAARVARAAVVADNVKNLVLSNVGVRWPEDKGQIAAPMAGFWGRNVEGGQINCPLLTPSHPNSPMAETAHCQVEGL